MKRSGEEPRAVFELSKWYLDVVSDDGDAFIAYNAEVRWRALALAYTSTLVQRAGQETRVESTLRSAAAPVLSGGVLSWSAPALGVAGKWTSLAPPTADTILASDEGRVEWRCHQPRARAEVTFDRAPAIRGLGYTEHLTLTLPPWQMPIDELRWGRFLSEDATLIWIDWRGAHRKQLVLLDGAPLGDARIDERGVEAGPVRLTLAEPRVLRQGALGKTALAVLPAVETVLPVRILATDERKWLARGTLEHGGVRAGGWVIHEVVRWP
jgi:hypothetical protein